MKDISVIIPIHKFDEELLKNALNSIPSEIKNVILVGEKDILDKCKNVSSKKLNFIFIENNGNTDFSSQINLAAKNCKTKFFSILEYDDMYTDIWFKNVINYKYNYDDVSIFLPITVLVDDENKGITALANEITWSTAFSNDIGIIDMDCLNSYFDFIISGGIFNTKDFNEIGGLKSSFKIVSPYEFLLRSTYNSKKIMVIPKIGYRHTYGRKDSYMVECEKNISQKHMNWLIKTALEEMYFNVDREKQFKE